MKLFYVNLAPVPRPGTHIALRAKSGLGLHFCRADLARKQLENGGSDYLLINPKGQVPALLLDDDILLTEGVAIMQYIADQVPDRLFAAPGSVARYQTSEHELRGYRTA